MLTVGTVSLRPTGEAHAGGNYSNDSVVETAHPDWMAWIPDATRLSELSIPGTHDSGAWAETDAADTQALTLSQQLESGIRAWDIRVQVEGDTLELWHGDFNLDLEFTDVLDAAAEFLDEHSTETILMRLGDAGISDDHDVNPGETFNDVLRSHLARPEYEGLTWNGNDYTPRLGEVRGKVIILENWSAPEAGGGGGGEFGLDYRGLLIRDDYHVTRALCGTETPGAICYRDKLAGVKENIELADTSTDTIVMTYTSGSTAVIPYDLAKGSLITPGMNEDVARWLFADRPVRSTGVVMTDFPGPALLTTILAHNLRLADHADGVLSLGISWWALDRDFSQFVSHVAVNNEDDDGDGHDDEALDRLEEMLAFFRHVMPGQLFHGFALSDSAAGNYSFQYSGLSGVSPYEDGYSVGIFRSSSGAVELTTGELVRWVENSSWDVSGLGAAARAEYIREAAQEAFPNHTWAVVARREPFGFRNWAYQSYGVNHTTAIPDGDGYRYGIWGFNYANDAPEILTIENPSPPAKAGDTITVTALVDDSHRDTLFCSYDWGDGTLTEGTVTALAGDRFLCVGEHAYAEGTSVAYRINVTVTDSEGAEVSGSIWVPVSYGAPAVNVPAAVTLDGNVIDLTADFTTPEPNEVYWVSIDYGDDTPISRVPDRWERARYVYHAYGAAGVFYLRITICNNSITAPLCGTATIEVTVAERLMPVVEITPDGLDVGEGSTTSFMYTVSDDDSSEFAPVGEPSCGAGGAYVPGSLHYSDEEGYFKCRYGDVGSVPLIALVSLTVANHQGDVGTGRVAITVANAAPTVTVQGPAVVGEGSEVRHYEFHAADPGGDPFSLTNVSCGSGTLVEESVQFVARTGEGALSCRFTDGHKTGPVEVTVTDLEEAAGTGQQLVTVHNVAPLVAMQTPSPTTEGAPVLVAATFTDPGDDTHTCVIDWGDGTTEAGTVEADTDTGAPDGAGSEGTCAGRHVYTDDGTFTIEAAVNDGEATTRATTTSTATNVAPEVTVPAVTPSPVLEGTPFTVRAGFVDVGSGDTHTCTIDYGDGSGLQDGTIDAAAGDCSGTHAYPDDGTYTIKMEVSDDDGGSASTSRAITAEEVVVTVQAPEISPSPSGEGGEVRLSTALFDPGALDMHTCTIDWGDGESAPGAVENSACVGSHTYVDDPTATGSDAYTVTVTVIEDGTATITTTHQHVVDNVDPTVEIAGLTGESGAPIDGDPVVAGTVLNLAAVFSDAGTLDTHTASVDWGDADVSTGRVTGAGKEGSVAANHTFTTPGTYTITLSITDDDDGVGAATVTVDVVDPLTAGSHVVSTLDAIEPVSRSAELHLDRAVSGLIGANDGRANNGALDKLERGNLRAALAALASVIRHLEAAERADESIDLNEPKTTLSLMALAIDSALG